MSRVAFAGSMLLAVIFLVVPSRGDDPPAKPKAKDIDLVLCLDISGSMEHLIDSAKQKLWDIVNDLAKVKPTPNLRVALYSYGATNYEQAKGWVKKDLDFVDDLDLVFKKLFEYRTNGGDEYVGRVCRDAVRDLKWSQAKDALKIVFVCGNEPATQDPLVKLPEVAALAKKHGVLINPIYCGGADDSDGRGWREFALMTGGRYANIDASRNVRVVVNTPFDKDIAALADKVNATYVPVGKKEFRDGKAKDQKAQTENSRQLGGANLAARVATQASALYKNSAWCLVDKLREDPKLDITKIPEAELSDELKKLKPAERVEYVQKKLQERLAIQKQVTELNTKREAYIRTEMQKQANDPTRGLDRALRETLRVQAESKGIQIPE
ncbi:MAG: VWA domain-containing protein [Gemmataceae bacterium]|nr:VWA domain-containing protein [Gemmataceae bacterium]